MESELTKKLQVSAVFFADEMNQTSKAVLCEIEKLCEKIEHIDASIPWPIAS